MRNKILLIIVCNFFLLIFVNAQSNQLNLDKYWHYRYRLVNQFMVVGGGKGQSLPATVRNKYGSGILDWGETPRYMGWYLGVLATEYRLLQNNGQSVERTLTELYYALRAIELRTRVVVKMVLYPRSCTSLLLGFMFFFPSVHPPDKVHSEN